MKIIMDMNNAHNFREVCVGNTFLWGEDLCVKIEEVRVVDKHENVLANVFNISANTLMALAPSDPIFTCEVEVHVKQ